MRFVVLAACVLSLCIVLPVVAQDPASEGQSKIQYGGGDGTTKDKAIVISGAANTFEGVDAEYKWVEVNLPGATIESSSLLMGKPAMDVLDVTLATGEHRAVYFDISSFFGKR